MKIIVILFCLSTYSNLFANKMNLNKNIIKKTILKKVNFNELGCKYELNEVFEIIINKDRHFLDKYSFAKKIADIVFTKKCNTDLNTRIEILLSLCYYQSDENVVYTYILAKHYGIHPDYYPLLLFFSPYKECPNFLLKIRTNPEFLKKLKPHQRKIITQIEQLNNLIKNKNNLKTITHSLICKTVFSNWYYYKYKKYYVNL